jgi:hypothetical protein
MDDERLQKIKGGGLLEVIRERPAMYLGQRSLSALSHYLQGFWMALSVYDIQSASRYRQTFMTGLLTACTFTSPPAATRT